MKWCCKISIMQFYKLFKKVIWKDIHILQNDCINKALQFAKISPWVCWWIWIFLSFLRKFHGSDFIPIGTLCSCDYSKKEIWAATFRQPHRAGEAGSKSRNQSDFEQHFLLQQYKKCKEMSSLIYYLWFLVPGIVYMQKI